MMYQLMNRGTIFYSSLPLTSPASYACFADKFAKVVTLLTCTRNVVARILTAKPIILIEVSLGFLHSFEASSGIIPLIRTRPLLLCSL
jgi:hypothetical protein